jgi:hypothetical protein
VLRHHEISSSPQKLPGPSMQMLVLLLCCSRYELCMWPRTINSIRHTGSPALSTCLCQISVNQFQAISCQSSNSLYLKYSKGSMEHIQFSHVCIVRLLSYTLCVSIMIQLYAWNKKNLKNPGYH